MSATDFQQVEPYLMNPSTVGLININTATATALACIPGIGPNLAPQVLAYRQSNPPLTPSISWLSSAMSGSTTALAQAGPYVTPFPGNSAPTSPPSGTTAAATGGSDLFLIAAAAPR